MPSSTDYESPDEQRLCEAVDRIWADDRDDGPTQPWVWAQAAAEVFGHRPTITDDATRERLTEAGLCADCVHETWRCRCCVCAAVVIGDGRACVCDSDAARVA